MTTSTNPTHVVVRRKYGSIAAKSGGCCGPQSSCCGGGRADAVARGLGYTDAELATCPGRPTSACPAATLPPWPA